MMCMPMVPQVGHTIARWAGAGGEVAIVRRYLSRKPWSRDVASVRRPVRDGTYLSRGRAGIPKIWSCFSGPLAESGKYKLSRQTTLEQTGIFTNKRRPYMWMILRISKYLHYPQFNFSPVITNYRVSRVIIHDIRAINTKYGLHWNKYLS